MEAVAIYVRNIFTVTSVLGKKNTDTQCFPFFISLLDYIHKTKETKIKCRGESPLGTDNFL